MGKVECSKCTRCFRIAGVCVKCFSLVSEERDELEAVLGAIVLAAKMPEDYQHGLPAWITELVIRGEAAAYPRTEDVEEIQRLQAIIASKLHVRRCHDCGHEFYAADSKRPYCLCDQCGSQDTRRVKCSTAAHCLSHRKELGRGD